MEKNLRQSIIITLFVAACGAESDPGGNVAAGGDQGRRRPDVGGGAPASHEQLLERLLSELPEEGSAELLEMRAQYQAELAALRPPARPPRGDLSVERSTQALTNGDGCTSPWWGDLLLGVVFLHPTDVFYNQCVWHDRCYFSGKGTYGFTRESCDTSWNNKMNDRCGRRYPWYVRATGVGAILYANCLATAKAMYLAVRLKGGDFFEETVCVGGQTWPEKGYMPSPRCSSYEPFDTRTPICTGATGLHTDGTVRSNWNGCRGSGCTACTELLAEFPNYFRNNPHCRPTTTCAGAFYQCGSACPPPDNADR